jgi:peptide/nickel transport system ATP-binding protein
LAFVEAKGLKKYFPVQSGFVAQLTARKREFVKAVDGIDLEIKIGEIYGLVGESGSGKTTTGRMTTALEVPTEGQLTVGGQTLSRIGRTELRRLRRRVQYIFQDPMSSLNPKMTVGNAVEEPLRYLASMTATKRGEAVEAILDRVGLSPPSSFHGRYPHELSGGQRQRVVIARALAVLPEYVVADEPVAMVDVSVRAQIMDLIMTAQRDLNLTVLLITHDLAVAKYMCSRISVMYLGKIVETGTREEIFSNPLHPYTQALLAAVPIPDPRLRTEKQIPGGEIPSAIEPPPGCRFHPRCPYAFDRCKVEEPQLTERAAGHVAACHLYDR